MKYIVAILLALSFHGTSAKEMNFSGLMPLVGQCWQATFPDGKKIDTHCFSSVYGGMFIKDQHVVCGGEQPYYGETWYAHDQPSGTVNYRYYNSLGGVSDGTVEFKPMQLVFPDETYENNGQQITYRTTWDLSEGQYVSNMWQQDAAVEGGWKPIWNMDFKSINIEEQHVVQFNQHHELHCH